MTDCPNGDVRDLLPDLLHDRLAPDVRRKVEAHVRTCADCAQELALLRAVRALLRRAPAVDVGTIAAAIPAYHAPARRSRIGWRVAAAIMILAAGGTSVAVLERGGAVAADSMVVPAGRATPGATGAAWPESAVATAPVAPRELALGNSAIGDLSDHELSALLSELPTLEVLPSVDVENGTAVSLIAPAGTE